MYLILSVFLTPDLTGRSNFDKEGNVLSILVPDDIDGQKQFVWKEVRSIKSIYC